MTDRLHNLSLPELIERESENYAERQTLLAAIEARMRAECPIKIERLYRVRKDFRSIAGRRLEVAGLTFNADYYHHRDSRFSPHIYLTAWGYLERPGGRRARIGYRKGSFNYKSTTLPVSALDPATEELPQPKEA